MAIRHVVVRLARSMIRAKRQVMLVAIMMCAAGIMVFAIDRADRRLEGPLEAADFVQFYTLGHLASEHRISAMYNMTALHEAQVALVPESKTFLYPPVYPPQIAMLSRKTSVADSPPISGRPCVGCSPRCSCRPRKRLASRCLCC